MGFEYEVESKNSVVYLEVKYDKLIQRLKEAEPGCQSIEVTNPTTNEVSTKYFRPFAAVTGNVIGLKWYKTELPTKTTLMGYKLSLSVDDENSPTGTTVAVLDLPFNRVAYNTFTKVAENIDPSLPLTVQVWVNKDKKAIVQFKQNGQTIKYKYTQQDMGECPPAVNNPLTGWDFKDQLVYLKDKIDNVVIPRIMGANKSEAISTVDTVQDEGYSGNASEDGDASFDMAELDKLNY